MAKPYASSFAQQFIVRLSESESSTGTSSTCVHQPFLCLDGLIILGFLVDVNNFFHIAPSCSALVLQQLRCKPLRHRIAVDSARQLELAQNDPALSALFHGRDMGARPVISIARRSSPQ